ncbi:MAG TPA: DnaJ domain-containing protein [Bryobacteraceae bacterium]|nr:DnaJ domain-containing protein [Bryobacteraceae bacterium]
MTDPSEKDLYSILGVGPDASEEEIRQAYRSRARVVHPDRFDPQRQPEDWQRANEMLLELNTAYSILSDTRRRREYDRIRANRFQKQQPPSGGGSRGRDTGGPSPDPFGVEDPAAGQVRYVDLPKHVQERLLKRQAGKEGEQFQVRLASLTWNYFVALASLGWFGYLFASADGAKWEESRILWYAGFTFGVSLLVGRNLLTIIKWRRSTLKPYFYVTPIYFVRTEYDVISFRPIWALKNVSVTHNYMNGLYLNSHVVLRFDGYEDSVRLSSKVEVERMCEWIKTCRGRIRTAYAAGNFEYFRKHDDFAGAPRASLFTNVMVPTGGGSLIYAVCVLVCAFGLLAAIELNDELSGAGWIQHPASATYAPPTPEDAEQPSPYALPPSHKVEQPSIPEKPLPRNGHVWSFTALERVAPFEIRAARGRHYVVKLVDAFTGTPVLTVFVYSGTSVSIDVPLGTFEVRYASGESWYGDEYLFGPNTEYRKADRTFTFEVVGNQVTGFTITLYGVPHGNLPTSAIEPAEF